MMKKTVQIFLIMSALVIATTSFANADSGKKGMMKEKLADVKEVFVEKGGSTEGQAVVDGYISKLASADKSAYKAKMKDLRGNLHTIMSADTFDKEAFLKASTEIQDAWGEVVTKMNVLRADTLEELSTEDRKILVEAIASEMPDHNGK